MPKKKENFLEKIVKKDYNNELEKVLEKKYFEENAKNILLNIIYKLEASYKDYETVKKNVMPKEEYITNFIESIKNNCDTLKIVKMNSSEKEILGNKTFLIDKRNKTIIVYPIERKVLYAISKISKKDKIIKDKYVIIDKTISDLINVGNNIDTVEVIRDFNGFSWTTVTKEIESIPHNLIYQNLKILLGYEFLKNWILNKEFIIDYFELANNKLEELYGRKNEKNIIDYIICLSVLLELKFDKIEGRKLKQQKEDIEKKIKQIENKEEFIKEKTREKRKLNKQIKQIDEIINDKKLLQKEYIERNELLPLNKKIFSMRILSNIMKEERQNLIVKLEQINDILNPQKFIQYKEDLENKYNYLKIVGTKDINQEINNELLKLQKSFLDCLEIKIDKSKEKSEIVNLLYQFRYYLMIPIDENDKILESKDLKNRLKKVSKKLVQKSIEQKVIFNFSKNEDLNYDIIKNVFETRIISLEDLYIKIVKENEKYYIQLFDENIFEEKVEIGNIEEINLNDINAKLNKSTKVFI